MRPKSNSWNNSMTAKVDPNTSKIIEYRSVVKISFGVEH
jgi:hypothetical protein